MRRERENYLDYVPRRNRNFPWKELENGLVVVRMENRGPMNRIAQKFFGRPPFSEIELDEFGSFVWKRIDGKRTVLEIGEALRENFGEKAEPLYERLSAFVKTLHQQRFVVYANKIK